MSGRIRAAGALTAILAGLAGSVPARARKPPLPNLRELSVTVQVSQVDAGGSFRARDTAKDSSRRKAGKSVVGFYLSRDAIRDPDDIHLAASRRVPRLRPNRSSRGDTTIRIPSSVAVGSYRLIACADDLNRIHESRERDNCAATASPIAVKTPTATLLAAGDVADCSLADDAATASVLASRTGAVAMLGDGAYPHGSSGDYASCYGPTWGRVKARTRPVPGDHDYETPGATGYFGYFGAAAGQPGQGWYSYDLGAWHVIALNSICSDIGGCGPGSAQIQWLQDDLAAHPAQCTLAYWHAPKYSAGSVGGSGAMDTAWDVLSSAGAELVLNGNDHDYERFPELSASGQPSTPGMREFVVGTAGAKLHAFKSAQPAAEARQATTHGVLQLTLRGDGYDWRFLPASGGSFTDAGSGNCH